MLSLFKRNQSLCKSSVRMTYAIYHLIETINNINNYSGFRNDRATLDLLCCGCPRWSIVQHNMTLAHSYSNDNYHSIRCTSISCARYYVFGIFCKPDRSQMIKPLGLFLNISKCSYFVLLCQFTLKNIKINFISINGRHK